MLVSAIRLLSLRWLLYIVNKLEELIAGKLKFHFSFIWQTKEHYTIIDDRTFHVFVMYPINFNFTVNPLKTGIAILIRKIQRNLDLNELAFVVVAVIEPLFQDKIGLLLEIIRQNPVSKPVKQ